MDSCPGRRRSRGRGSTRRPRRSDWSQGRRWILALEDVDLEVEVSSSSQIRLARRRYRQGSGRSSPLSVKEGIVDAAHDALGEVTGACLAKVHSPSPRSAQPHGSRVGIPDSRHTIAARRSWGRTAHRHTARRAWPRAMASAPHHRPRVFRWQVPLHTAEGLHHVPRVSTLLPVKLADVAVVQVGS